jgi:vacuolar-type H+-ATPase subunit H
VQELLRVILEAEADARRQLAAAQQEGERQVREAEEHGRQRIREARDSHEGIARAVEAELVAAARQQAQQLTESQRAKVTAMRALAEPRMEGAVQTALAHVLGRDNADDW